MVRVISICHDCRHCDPKENLSYRPAKTNGHLQAYISTENCETSWGLMQSNFTINKNGNFHYDEKIVMNLFLLYSGNSHV